MITELLYPDSVTCRIYTNNELLVQGCLSYVWNILVGFFALVLIVLELDLGLISWYFISDKKDKMKASKLWFLNFSPIC